MRKILYLELKKRLSRLLMADSGDIELVSEERIKQILQEQSIPYTDFKSEKMNLEDVFIGLTGKY